MSEMPAEAADHDFDLFGKAAISAYAKDAWRISLRRELNDRLTIGPLAAFQGQVRFSIAGNPRPRRRGAGKIAAAGFVDGFSCRHSSAPSTVSWPKTPGPRKPSGSWIAAFACRRKRGSSARARRRRGRKRAQWTDEPAPSLQQRPPRGVAGVIRRRHLVFAVAENVGHVDMRPARAAGI